MIPFCSLSLTGSQLSSTIVALTLLGRKLVTGPLGTVEANKNYNASAYYLVCKHIYKHTHAHTHKDTYTICLLSGNVRTSMGALEGPGPTAVYALTSIV